MYLPCMSSDLDDEGLETPRRIGDWGGARWNRVRLRLSELTNPRKEPPLFYDMINYYALCLAMYLLCLCYNFQSSILFISREEANILRRSFYSGVYKISRLFSVWVSNLLLLHLYFFSDFAFFFPWSVRSTCNLPIKILELRSRTWFSKADARLSRPCAFIRAYATDSY